MENEPNVIKVAAASSPAAVAGAIAGMMREEKPVIVQAIGAGAVNQAVKAIAIARGYLKEDDIKIAFLPEFVEMMIDDRERTAMRFVVIRYEPAG